MKRAVCAGAVLGISLLVMTASYACSCSSLPTPDDRFSSADFVFSGIVTKELNVSPEWRAEGSWSRYAHTIRVDKVWKGDVKAEVLLYQTGGFDCQYDFNVRGIYLIYAYIWPHPETKEPVIKTSLCNDNKQFVEAREDLAWLGPGHPPTGREVGFLKNYPNPFRKQTRLVYDVPSEGFVDMAVYDLTGRRRRQLVSEVQMKGLYTLPVNADGLAPGVYFCRLRVEAGPLVVRQLVLIN